MLKLGLAQTVFFSSDSCPSWAVMQLVIHEVQVKLLYACVLSELLRVTTGSSWTLKGVHWFTCCTLISNYFELFLLLNKTFPQLKHSKSFYFFLAYNPSFWQLLPYSREVSEHSKFCIILHHPKFFDNNKD